MNLEEKAQEYYNECCELGYNGDQIGYSIEDFKAGYKQSIADITEFIRVNPKATHQAIIEYMEGIV